MQTDQPASNSQDDHDDLPDFSPLPPPMKENTDEPAAEAEAATEPIDVNPVFGNNAQPQAVYDQEIVGTNEEPEAFKGENATTNFDPENDPRMQETPEEE